MQEDIASQYNQFTLVEQRKTLFLLRNEVPQTCPIMEPDQVIKTSELTGQQEISLSRRVCSSQCPHLRIVLLSKTVAEAHLHCTHTPVVHTVTIKPSNGTEPRKSGIQLAD